MTNWKIVGLAAIATSMVIPLTVNVARANSEIDNIQESNQIQYLAKGMKHGRRGRGMDKLLENIDLTTEQSESIAAIREQSKETAENLHEQLETQHQEMKSLMTGDADTEAIRQQYRETQLLREQLSDNRFETMLQIRELLTPEQRAEVAELMEQHRGRRDGSDRPRN